MDFFHVGKKIGPGLPAIEQGDGMTPLQCTFNDRWSEETGAAENEDFFC